MNAEIKAVLQEMRLIYTRHDTYSPTVLWYLDRLESLLQPEQVAAQSERDADASFEAYFKAGGYQYGYEERGDAHAWFVAGFEQAATSRTTPQQEWQKDAERYRWMKDNMFQRMNLRMDGTKDLYVPARHSWLIRVQNLDAAIDAAMSAAPPANSSGG